MGVPTTGNFSIFGAEDNTTIAGAIVEGGANSTTVTNTNNFNTLKGLADISRFDDSFKEGATTLEEVTKTDQFRGYPTAAGTTIVAAVILQGPGTGCGDDQAAVFSNVVYIDETYDDFVENGAGKLVLNNGVSFGGMTTPIYTLGSGVSTSSKSLVSSTPTLDSSNTSIQTLLVNEQSYNNQAGDQVTATLTNDGQISFTMCAAATTTTTTAAPICTPATVTAVYQNPGPIS